MKAPLRLQQAQFQFSIGDATNTRRVLSQSRRGDSFNSLFEMRMSKNQNQVAAAGGFNSLLEMPSTRRPEPWRLDPTYRFNSLLEMHK